MAVFGIDGGRSYKSFACDDEWTEGPKYVPGTQDEKLRISRR